MKNKKGFTLLEIMIVIVIIGILSTLGISQYIPARERAFGKEAIANLKLIRAAEKIYYMELGTYYGPQNNVTFINTNLKLQLVETNWDYNIESANATSFTAIADRQGSGTYSTCLWQITQDQNQDEPTVRTGPCL